VASEGWELLLAQGETVKSLSWEENVAEALVEALAY